MNWMIITKLRCFPLLFTLLQSPSPSLLFQLRGRDTFLCHGFSALLFFCLINSIIVLFIALLRTANYLSSVIFLFVVFVCYHNYYIFFGWHPVSVFIKLTNCYHCFSINSFHTHLNFHFSFTSCFLLVCQRTYENMNELIKVIHWNPRALVRYHSPCCLKTRIRQTFSYLER